MISQQEYKKHLTRIDELLQVVGNDTPLTDPAFIELNELSDLVADYEEVYHPVSKPGLIDVIRLRMTEMELNQKQLADLLETPTSRISEYLKGKRDITLDVARRLHQRLNIDADIILQ
ncbi:MAG: helix-turn-helix domain-containing protein [Marinoscillum sp.]